MVAMKLILARVIDFSENNDKILPNCVLTEPKVPIVGEMHRNGIYTVSSID